MTRQILPSVLQKPLDPRAKAFDERWEAFEGAGYKGQISLFLQTLEEKELMDSERAFEMLNTLSEEVFNIRR